MHGSDTGDQALVSDRVITRAQFEYAVEVGAQMTPEGIWSAWDLASMLTPKALEGQMPLGYEGMNARCAYIYGYDDHRCGVRHCDHDGNVFIHAFVAAPGVTVRP